MRNHYVELNWRSRSVRPPRVLKGHDEHVITCLQFNDSKIVSGSDDNTLKVSQKPARWVERSLEESQATNPKFPIHRHKY